MTVGSDRGGTSSALAVSKNFAGVSNANGSEVLNGVVAGSSTGLNHAGSMMGDVSHTGIIAGATVANSTVATTGNTIMTTVLR